MKKLLAIFLVCALMSVSVTFAENSDFSAMTDAELRTLIDAVNLELAARQLANAPSPDVIAAADFDGVHLEVLGFSLSKETLGANQGAPAVVIQCRFMNTGTDDKSFAQLVNVTAFQNLIECKGGSLIEGTNGSMNTTKIQPGGTFEVPVGRLLSDTENPVEIQFGTLFKPDLLTLTFDPSI